MTITVVTEVSKKLTGKEVNLRTHGGGIKDDQEINNDREIKNSHCG